VPPGSGRPAQQIRVDVRKLWAGGAATAIVAALVAMVTVLVESVILDVTPVAPGWLLGDGSNATLTTRFAVTAAVAALLATGLMQLLLATTPRPTRFFGWIVALATVAAAVVPFGLTGDVAEQLAAAVAALLIGIVIGALISGAVSSGRVVQVGP